jgi:S-adenosylmethionine hydrolase
MAIVTLTTDFGTADGYVGAMKGVIASIAPDAVIVDITHEIPPQDVAAAAFALCQAAPCFPPGTVHVAVVDPGVGGPRRSVAVDDGWQRFVAPDNGVLSLVAPSPRAVHEIKNPDWARVGGRGEPAPTFNGRDLFAPAAARLAAGAEVEGAGPAVTLAARLFGAPPVLARDGERLLGHVIHVDRFGNLVSDVPGPKEPGGFVVRIGAERFPLRRTYRDVARGEPVAYVGSSGTVELGVREGSAAARFGLLRGAAMVVEPGEASAPSGEGKRAAKAAPKPSPTPRPGRKPKR